MGNPKGSLVVNKGFQKLQNATIEGTDIIIPSQKTSNKFGSLGKNLRSSSNTPMKNRASPFKNSTKDEDKFRTNRSVYMAYEPK